MLVQLAIHVPASQAPINSLNPCPQARPRSFRLPTDSDVTIGELRTRIENFYNGNYRAPQERLLSILVLQDEKGLDLWLHYKIKDLFIGLGFPDPHVIKIVRDSLDRDSSIPPHSGLRNHPALIGGEPQLAFTRPATPVPVASGSQDNFRRPNSESHINSDHPMPSCEDSLDGNEESDARQIDTEHQDILHKGPDNTTGAHANAGTFVKPALPAKARAKASARDLEHDSEYESLRLQNMRNPYSTERDHSTKQHPTSETARKLNGQAFDIFEVPDTDDEVGRKLSDSRYERLRHCLDPKSKSYQPSNSQRAKSTPRTSRRKAFDISSDPSEEETQPVYMRGALSTPKHAFDNDCENDKSMGGSKKQRMSYPLDLGAPRSEPAPKGRRVPLESMSPAGSVPNSTPGKKRKTVRAKSVAKLRNSSSQNAQKKTPTPRKSKESKHSEFIKDAEAKKGARSIKDASNDEQSDVANHSEGHNVARGTEYHKNTQLMEAKNANQKIPPGSEGQSHLSKEQVSAQALEKRKDKKHNITCKTKDVHEINHASAAAVKDARSSSNDACGLDTNKIATTSTMDCSKELPASTIVSTDKRAVKEGTNGGTKLSTANQSAAGNQQNREPVRCCVSASAIPRPHPGPERLEELREVKEKTDKFFRELGTQEFRLLTPLEKAQLRAHNVYMELQKQPNAELKPKRKAEHLDNEPTTSKLVKGLSGEKLVPANCTAGAADPLISQSEIGIKSAQTTITTPVHAQRNQNPQISDQSSRIDATNIIKSMSVVPKKSLSANSKSTARIKDQSKAGSKSATVLAAKNMGSAVIPGNRGGRRGAEQPSSNAAKASTWKEGGGRTLEREVIVISDSDDPKGATKTTRSVSATKNNVQIQSKINLPAEQQKVISIQPRSKSSTTANGISSGLFPSTSSATSSAKPRNLSPTAYIENSLALNADSSRQLSAKAPARSMGNVFGKLWARPEPPLPARAQTPPDDSESLKHRVEIKTPKEYRWASKSRAEFKTPPEYPQSSQFKDQIVDLTQVDEASPLGKSNGTTKTTFKPKGLVSSTPVANSLPSAETAVRKVNNRVTWSPATYNSSCTLDLTQPSNFSGIKGSTVGSLEKHSTLFNSKASKGLLSTVSERHYMHGHDREPPLTNAVGKSTPLSAKRVASPTTINETVHEKESESNSARKEESAVKRKSSTEFTTGVAKKRAANPSSEEGLSDKRGLPAPKPVADKVSYANTSSKNTTATDLQFSKTSRISTERGTEISNKQRPELDPPIWEYCRSISSLSNTPSISPMIKDSATSRSEGLTKQSSLDPNGTSTISGKKTTSVPQKRATEPTAVAEGDVECASSPNKKKKKTSERKKQPIESSPVAESVLSKDGRQKMTSVPRDRAVDPTSVAKRSIERASSKENKSSPASWERAGNLPPDSGRIHSSPPKPVVDPRYETPVGKSIAPKPVREAKVPSTKALSSSENHGCDGNLSDGNSYSSSSSDSDYDDCISISSHESDVLTEADRKDIASRKNARRRRNRRNHLLKLTRYMRAPDKYPKYRTPNDGAYGGIRGGWEGFERKMAAAKAANEAERREKQEREAAKKAAEVLGAENAQTAEKEAGQKAAQELVEETPEKAAAQTVDDADAHEA